MDSEQHSGAAKARGGASAHPRRADAERDVAVLETTPASLVRRPAP